MIFKHAVINFEAFIREALDPNQLQPEVINLLIPHQANLRISQYIQKQFGFPNKKVCNNIQKYGNTNAASIPIALSSLNLVSKGWFVSGKLVYMVAFGSGFTWSSALVFF